MLQIVFFQKLYVEFDTALGDGTESKIVKKSEFSPWVSASLFFPNEASLKLLFSLAFDRFINIYIYIYIYIYTL